MQQPGMAIDYYHRFMKAYPTVVHLEADEQEVLSLWGVWAITDGGSACGR